jgi:ATP-binding cassette subfamily B protein
MEKIQKTDRGALMRFTWHYWRRRPVAGLICVFFMMAAVAADVFIPVMTSKIVNSMTSALQGVPMAQAVDESWRYFLGFAATSLTYHLCHSTAIFCWNWFAVRNLYDIVTDGLAQVQRFSTDWHANSFAGATVRKLTRGMWSFDTFEDTIFMGFLPSVCMVVFTTIMLAITLPAIAIYSTIMVAIYVGVSVWMSLKILAPRFTLSAAADTRMGARLADIITGIPTVKSFATEHTENQRFQTVAQEWKRVALRAWQTSHATDLIRAFLRIGLLLGALGLTIWLWQTGKAKPGDLALVITAFFILGGYLRDIGRHINDLQRSASEVTDVVEFWQQQPDIRDHETAQALKINCTSDQRGEIVFDNVCFGYGKHDRLLFNDLSLTIQPGEKIALVGMSGSGKTSFVKLVQRLYDVNSGEIRIDGQNIAAVTQQSLRQAIALVPQEPILFHRTLAENIAYGRPGASMEQIVDAARQAYADDFIAHLPDGYQTLVGERGIKLSGGERQRVAIARAILADCPILIMDEATSSLDSVSEHEIQKAMAHLMHGRTTLTIAHRLATIRQVDRILVFEKGKIVEQGNHDSLIARPDSLYRRLHDMQAL